MNRVLFEDAKKGREEVQSYRSNDQEPRKTSPMLSIEPPLETVSLVLLFELLA